MMALDRLLAPNQFAARLLDTLQPLMALATRLYVGWAFFKSGLWKINHWDQTIGLFESEYRTPVLSPAAAAILGAFGELAFPIFLWLGLYGRLSAMGLSAVNAVAVISYAHVLLAEGFEAAIGQHKLWGFMLLMLAIYGPGKLSLDYLLGRQAVRAGNDVRPASVTI
jgi:putative oxidoreductase